MRTLDLNGTWKFKAIDQHGALPRGAQRAFQWMTGTVPGTVHTDLMAEGVIPDPFFRMNENDVRWVENPSWIYRREFHVLPDLLAEEEIALVCEGIDTYASICINGRPAGETANMFVEHRFDVKRLLHVGKNTIEVTFTSPGVRSKSLEKAHQPLRVALQPHRVYVRKAQYSFGWDWGPTLTTSGIWRAIGLQAWSGGRLHDPFARVVSVGKRGAVVELSVEVDRRAMQRMEVEVRVAGHGFSLEKTIPLRGRNAPLRVLIPDPKLWWPNGYGGQPLYTAAFVLRAGGKELDRIERSFGVRTIHLVQQREGKGKSFIIEVNKTPVYCKGADWIPADSFLPRVTEEKYEKLLTMAREAHMTMIRVWGGGIYEQDAFYEACDRFGLMVWQDFMFACGEYPQEPWFLAQVKEEAEKVVKRLRNHPSLVVWCGNNECEWLFCTENPGKTADDMRGAAIFRDILPSVVSQLDGTRIYWRSSPFGDGSPNDESNGTHHQWKVWSDWKDYGEYTNDSARFIAEFGFQAPPDPRTFAEAMLPTDLSPQSPVMEHHNKQVEGQERLFRFQAAHYRVASDWEEFILKCQFVQAEALKTAVEHWRQRKFATSGSLFWQLNDCWPVSSWAVIDSALRPKAGYYYAKRFFAPLLVMFHAAGEGYEVRVVNDLLKPVSGTLKISRRSFTGRTVWKRETPCRIPANSASTGAIVRERDLVGLVNEDEYLHAVLFVKGKSVAENRMFFAEPRCSHFPAVTPKVTIAQKAEGMFAITLHADAFVKNLRLSLSGGEAMFEDNYFDLDPGERKTVLCRTDEDIRLVRSHLILRPVQ